MGLKLKIHTQILIAVALGVLTGLLLEGIGVILAVDRLLDMCRTTVNVWGDVCGAAIISKLDKRNEVEKRNRFQ